MLNNESEENILPLQGQAPAGWKSANGSNDGSTGGTSGGGVVNGIGKKVEIEVTVENIPYSKEEDLEKGPGPMSPTGHRRI